MKTKNRLLSLLVLLSLCSCDDVFEEDITNDMVQVISPQNNQQIYSNVVNFQWNELDGADKYRLQIYNNTSTMVIDSLVTNTSVSFPLLQGAYQWRIRGENSAYVSNYTFNNNFAVFETDDLTNQQVLLTSPEDGFYTRLSTLVLDWEDLNAADTYNFELINITDGNVIVNQQTGLTNSSLTLTPSNLSTDAEYRWRVKALNSDSETLFFSKKFYRDTNIPNTPVNQLPANNSTQTINQQLNFSWTIPDDYGAIQSPITYTIEFANNVNFSPVIQSSEVTQATFQSSFATAGEYYWRVRAKDKATNTGSYSSPFKFTIN